MNELRLAAGTLWRALRGTSRRRILDREFRVVAAARGESVDRDWPVLQALARGRRSIWDIGANLGMTSLLMADVLADAGRLYAIEASEAACLAIQDNARLNALAERIEVINTVVGDRPGTLPFFWHGAAGGASIQQGYLGHRRRLVKASSSLDALAADLEPPDLIKIDVEGAESLVIAGGRRVLAEHRPVVVVELHPFGDGDLADQARAILGTLRQVDYRMVYLRTGETLDDLDVLRSRGRTHVLLLDRDAPLPAALAGVDTSAI